MGYQPVRIQVERVKTPDPNHVVILHCTTLSWLWLKKWGQSDQTGDQMIRRVIRRVISRKPTGAVAFVVVWVSVISTDQH